VRRCYAWAGDESGARGLVDTPKRWRGVKRNICEGYGENPAMHIWRDVRGKLAAMTSWCLLRTSVSIPIADNIIWHRSSARATSPNMPTDKVLHFQTGPRASRIRPAACIVAGNG